MKPPLHCSAEMTEQKQTQEKQTQEKWKNNELRGVTMDDHAKKKISLRRLVQSKPKSLACSKDRTVCLKVCSTLKHFWLLQNLVKWDEKIDESHPKCNSTPTHDGG